METKSHIVHTDINLLCDRGWYHISHPSPSALWKLGLQAWTTIAVLIPLWELSPGSVHPRQVLYKLNHIPRPYTRVV